MIWTKLLKVAVCARRLWLSFSSIYPWKKLFVQSEPAGGSGGISPFAAPTTPPSPESRSTDRRTGMLASSVSQCLLCAQLQMFAF